MCSLSMQVSLHPRQTLRRTLPYLPHQAWTLAPWTTSSASSHLRSDIGRVCERGAAAKRGRPRTPARPTTCAITPRLSRANV